MDRQFTGWINHDIYSKDHAMYWDTGNLRCTLADCERNHKEEDKMATVTQVCLDKIEEVNDTITHTQAVILSLQKSVINLMKRVKELEDKQ